MYTAFILANAHTGLTIYPPFPFPLSSIHPCNLHLDVLVLDLVLPQVSVTLPEKDEETLTPQLLHPQLEQSPPQLEQLAQEQGDIFGRMVGNVKYGG